MKLTINRLKRAIEEEVALALRFLRFEQQIDALEDIIATKITQRKLKQIIKEELLKEAYDRYQDSAGKIFKLIPRKKGGMKIGCSVNSCNMRPLNPAEWAAEMKKAPPPLGSCKGSGCYKNIGPK